MSVVHCGECERAVDTDEEEMETIDDMEVCDGCADKMREEARSAREDQRLDDPRHGQAADLNRRYR